MRELLEHFKETQPRLRNAVAKHGRVGEREAAGPALRLAEDPAPFDLVPEFVVVETSYDDTPHMPNIPLLARLVCNRSPSETSLSLLYYESDGAEQGRRVYRRNGVTDDVTDDTQYVLLQDGVVQAMDNTLQRVSTAAGRSLMDVLCAAKEAAKKRTSRRPFPGHGSRGRRMYGRGYAMKSADSSAWALKRHRRDKGSVDGRKQARGGSSQPTKEARPTTTREAGGTPLAKRRRVGGVQLVPGMTSMPSSVAPGESVTNTSSASPRRSAFLVKGDVRPATFQLPVFHKDNSHLTALISLLISRRMMGSFDTSEVTEQATSLFQLMDDIIQDMRGSQQRKLKVCL